MIKKPLVSIVVPVYNAETFLAYAIKSVQGQTYENWELLLVNDGSTDNSLGIIKKSQEQDKRIKLISLKQNGGVAHARNQGIKSAQGRFLAFLDADDFWTSNKLENQISFMTEEADANRIFTFTGYSFSDREGKVKGGIVKAPHKVSLKDYLKNNIIWTTTVVIDLDAIAKSEVYMKNISYGEDALAWIEILKHSKYAYGLNEVSAYYRRGSSSLSSNKFKAISNKFHLYQNIDELNFITATYYFSRSLISATIKRI